MKKYNNIDRQMEGTGSGFKFAGILGIMYDTVNASKHSSYTQLV